MNLFSTGNLGRCSRVIVPCVLAAVMLANTACQPGATATPSPEPTVAPLTGKLTREAIEAHSGWEQLRAQDYTPDSAAIEAIRDKAANVEVILFVGTWCGDSKREVPRFFKIWDQAGLSMSGVTILGLDRTKKDAEGLTEKWSIEFVPTFIFVRDGHELGRIVERPAGATLEGDIASILSQS